MVKFVKMYVNAAFVKLFVECNELFFSRKFIEHFQRLKALSNLNKKMQNLQCTNTHNKIQINGIYNKHTNIKHFHTKHGKTHAHT